MKLLIISFLISSVIIFRNCTSEEKSMVRQVSLKDFYLQSSELISQTGEEISSENFRNDIYWFPVKVPSTVLTGLVANRVYPDPYSGMNNMLIPDASDEFNKTYDLEKYSHVPGSPNPWKSPYWYRTQFDVPSSEAGRRFDLIFKGINYRAAVWLNGKQIADSTVMAGMFSEYRFDVTGAVNPGNKNYLAVKIYPLDYPGLPSPEQLKGLDDFYPNGGTTGDIGKNVTMLCSVGWDWMPPVRDRNIGIWQPVYLRSSGFVTIEKPKIVTELPSLPDTSVARITLSMILNNSGREEAQGTITVSLSPESSPARVISFSREVKVSGGGTAAVEFTPDNAKELVIRNPELWWPNGYGRPSLYQARIRFEPGSGQGDEISFRFGIRTVGTEAIETNGVWRRDFFINGRRIHITGGAWVPDMMLNRDSIRYDREFRLCRNANINLVRIWGGGVTPSDLFFDAADRYGLLVWSDFWITGDTQGEFKGSPDWPLDGEIFKKNVASTIYRIRNHPSLLLWTGGNEGHARKELYYAMRDSVIRLDGTRPFIPSSSGFARLPEGWDGSWPDGKPAGVYSGGPYVWTDPRVYFRKADAGRDWVFKDETGIPSQPVWTSLPKIIPNLVWDKSLPFPLNDSWGYHDAATGNGRYDLYLAEMVKRYGQPSSMKEFSDKMQLMNAAGYQGIFEAAGHRLNEIGGVMLWKLNAAFPSVVWQVYDWYLMPNAGYYFMQSACEPVHIQFNPVDLAVEYVNRTYESLKDIKSQVMIYDINSKLVYSESETVNLDGPSSSESSLEVKEALKNASGISFIILNLYDNSDRIISHNGYWYSGSDDFKDLNNLTVTDIDANAEGISGGKDLKRWQLTVTNPTGRIAFFINPRLMSGEEEVTPSLWSANYFTLAPGESITVTVAAPNDMMKSGKLKIRIEGWNIVKQEIELIQ